MKSQKILICPHCKSPDIIIGGIIPIALKCQRCGYQGQLIEAEKINNLGRKSPKKIKKVKIKI